MTVENFNFGPNTCHKGKGDGISNRERKQVTTVEVSGKGAEKVVSAVKPGKGKDGR